MPTMLFSDCSRIRNYPENLFRSGQPGVFLDISQPYSYQDAAGTTLATADTNPLGLIYDLKNGVPVLGASLTLLATTADKTTDGTTTVNVLATSGIVGKAVRVQFTVASITGSFTVSSTGTSGTSVTVSATGSYDIVVMAGATGGNIKFEGLTTSRFSVAGIVIKELPGSHAYQATTTARPLLASSPKRAVFDKADDNLNVYFPSAITGTLLQSSKEGIIHAEISKAAGVWPVTVTPAYFPSNNICHLIVRDGVMSDAEVASAKNWMVAQGAGRDFAGVTSIGNWLRGRTELTNVHFAGMNLSSVASAVGFMLGCTALTSVDFSGVTLNALTNANSMLFGCTGLTSITLGESTFSLCTNLGDFAKNCSSLSYLNISSFNLVSATTCQNMLQGCYNLTTLIVGTAFSNSPCISYASAFSDCKLNQASMDGILNSINAANTSNGTLGMLGANNATPSAGVLAGAVVQLRARGWTITNSNGW